MYDDVLVPTDGSDTVEATLEHALPIAVQHDATVHALYAVDQRITLAAETDAQEEIRSTLESDGEAAVADVRERAEAEGLDVVTELRQGTPWKEILDYTDEKDVDLIAIGTHGKSPREKITSLGSVSERVVDNASVPVFVVRDGDRS